MPDLPAVVIVDYQNVHLTAAGLFAPNAPEYESLIHPLAYGLHLISRRNANQRDGMPDAVLSKVLVYRGLPSSEHDAKAYGRNLAQKSEWERDRRIQVTHRALRYVYEKTSDGYRATDSSGRPMVKSKREKGIDVLCALALVREAQSADVDLVILASQDSDLEPALDEACELGSVAIETASWFDLQNPRASKEIRPSGRKIWNTRLDYGSYTRSVDPRQY